MRSLEYLHADHVAGFPELWRRKGEMGGLDEDWT